MRKKLEKPGILPTFHVISDGTYSGTTVFDHNGNKVGSLIAMKYELQPGDSLPVLHISIAGATINARGVPHIEKL